MRLNMRTKFSATIVGVVALALMSSILAMLSTWKMGSLPAHVVRENLASIQVAKEVQMALCEPRAFVASYILDGGNPTWLKDLEGRKCDFNERLEEARNLAHTPKEAEILAKLEDVHRRYDAKRNEVVALYDRGRVDAAKAMLFQDVNILYKEASDDCEEFIALNKRHVEQMIQDAETQVRWVTWIAAGTVASTVGFGTLLLWLFFHGVVRPLRQMVTDVRFFSGEGPATAAGRSDELGAVGEYLRTLMSDVADTRSTLGASRNQLMAAEKLATVGKLAASVAHEIRNPLTAIRMWLFAIRKAVRPDAELSRKFETLSEELSRLESIVRNFLEFSRPPALKLRSQCIADVLNKTLELVHHQMEDRQIRVLREETPDLPPVMADPDQLKQVLVNLLNNAVEVMPHGGDVRIRTALEPDGRTGSMIAMHVQDGGGGISQEVRQRIFEPFYTTKETGTGLGLCIAAAIMARHGGRLVLEPPNGAGASFSLLIPTAGR